MLSTLRKRPRASFLLAPGSVGGVVCKERGGESRRVVRVVCDPVVGVQKPLRVGGVDKRRGSSVQKPVGKCGWHLQPLEAW